MGSEQLINYLFTQGILGVACIVLGVVCIKLYNSREADRKEWREEVRLLNEQRREEIKDLTQEVNDVLSGNSQNMRILSEKIEIAKGRR